MLNDQTGGGRAVLIRKVSMILMEQLHLYTEAWFDFYFLLFRVQYMQWLAQVYIAL